MTLEIFLAMLMMISLLTGLTVEGVKKLLDEAKVSYKSNVLAGVIAVVLAIAVAVAYLIIIDAIFTAKIAVYLIALMFLSWLCAMIGYDKVVQTLSQLKK